jgi:hypothetical protein
MDGIFLTTELQPTRGGVFRLQNIVDAFERPIDILYPPDLRIQVVSSPHIRFIAVGLEYSLCRDCAVAPNVLQ